MDDDWDLQAVVRSCTSATTYSSITPSSPPPQPPLLPPPTSSCDASSLQSFSSNFQSRPLEDNNLICFQDLFEQTTQTEDKGIEIQELHDLCKPFCFQTSKPQPISPQNVPVSPPSVLAYFQDLSSQQQTQTQPQPPPLPLPQQQLLIQRHLHQSNQQTPSINISRKRDSSNISQNPRSKKRKNQMKKVCHIPAEGLSADMWSWRKYGQKPIKGSPYPRGYYKCSTSKGCLARKQVERDRSNPNMLIVTYTGEHNHPMPTHRNSLAGSTRQKPGTTSDDPNKPATPSVDSPTEKMETTAGEEEDEDDFDISNIPLDDDFFAGLEDELVNLGPLSQGPAHNKLSWVNNVTTTAAGSG